MEGLGKRRYYKNRWFWFVGILLTVIFLLSSPVPKTVDTSATGIISTPQIIKPGTYKAGEDIKAGAYILVSDKAISAKIIKHLWIFNYEVYQTKGFTREAIIIGDNHYLTIETDNCMIYPAAYAPKADIKDGKLNPGVYLTGLDIAAGKYNIYNYSFAEFGTAYTDTNLEFVSFSSVFSGKTQKTLKNNEILIVRSEPIIIAQSTETTEIPSITYIRQTSIIIGDRIKPGEYVFVPDDDMTNKNNMYYSVEYGSTNTSGYPSSFDVYGRGYVTFMSGQKVKLDGCKVYTLENAPKVEILDGKLPEGMYKIGTDIPAGTYSIVSRINKKGRYYISNDSKHIDIKYNDFQGTASVTVKVGQYLYVEDGYVLVN